MIYKGTSIIACKAKQNYVLWIKFADGIEGEVNLGDLVGKGVFNSWKSKEFFENVTIDPISKTVAWGDEIDLDPFVLKQDILNNAKGKK